MKLYNIQEVFQFAMRIEENGERCYTLLAKKFAHDTEMAAFFSKLAAEEGDHTHLFTRMAAQVHQQAPLYPLDDDGQQFLRNFADGAVFCQVTIEERISRIHSITDALAFAMEREQEAVTYYEQMKLWVPEEEHNALEQVIEEERSHYTALHREFEKMNGCANTGV